MSLYKPATPAQKIAGTWRGLGAWNDYFLGKFLLQPVAAVLADSGAGSSEVKGKRCNGILCDLSDRPFGDHISRSAVFIMN